MVIDEVVEVSVAREEEETELMLDVSLPVEREGEEGREGGRKEREGEVREDRWE